MYIPTTQSMNGLLIVEVLKAHSDHRKRLAHPKIMMLLTEMYGVTIDRHTLKQDLDNLVALNCGVKRAGASGWYFDRKITDPEIHMLIDSLSLIKYMPYSSYKNLLNNLASLASTDFKYGQGLPENRAEHVAVFSNIEQVLSAISTNKQISFHLTHYDIDRKSRIVHREGGTAHKYTVSPYEIVVVNGHYYLICAHDQADELCHHRLDKLTDLTILQEGKRRPCHEIPGYPNGFNLSTYMEAHPHMHSGQIAQVTFRVEKSATQHVLDRFGSDVCITSETEHTATVSLSINEQIMLQWALQHGSDVEILSPQSLRDKIRDTIQSMHDKYR